MQHSPTLVHYCDECHYNTPVKLPTAKLTEGHVCAHCGHCSTGADLIGRAYIHMDPSQQDELAQLFAQSMHFTTAAQQHQLEQMRLASRPVVIEQVQAEKQDASPVHFVSGHYTGTAHVGPYSISEASCSPPPSYPDSLIPQTMADVLRRHSIDPAALLPTQVQLFQNADDDQKLRLLELWRISPPSYPQLERMGDMSSTSLEREEALAKARYEERQQHPRRPLSYATRAEEHMLDTHIPRSHAEHAGFVDVPMEAEPYIVDVYDSGRAAKSLDPVYIGSPGLWYIPSMSSSEDQYGMYEQIRNHADWERMNERIARQQLAAAQAQSLDDSMML